MNFDAFKDAPWFDNSYKVIIGGLGNIGSWTSLLLARMGYELYLYDNDVVEARNVGSQFYSMNDLGKLKTTAMKDHIINLTGNRKLNLFSKYEESGVVGDIMISCFDNMEARKVMFNKWLHYQKNKKLRTPTDVNIFIDGRSQAEIGYVFSVKGRKEAERYMNELFNDEDVEDAECSFKSTSHNGSLIGSLITTVLANHITNKKQGAKHRVVPFMIDYQLPIINFIDEV